MKVRREETHSSEKEEEICLSRVTSGEAEARDGLNENER